MEKIKYLEFQLHNICNRTCEFCPVFSHGMWDTPEDCERFNEIIDKLDENREHIHEDAIFYFNRYFEPTVNWEQVYEKLKYARSKFSNKFVAHTNSMLLTKDIVNEMTEVLDRVTVNIYERINRIDLTVWIILHFKGVSIKDVEFDDEKCVAKITLNGTLFVIRHNKDETIKLYNRGSMLYKGEERGDRCGIPKNTLNIEYNGNLMPCCDTYSSFTDQMGMLVGNILEDDFDTILKSINEFDSREHAPCKHCDRDYESLID